MKNDIISIIVPVYNVEMYLERCLDSIVNQTYKNLEILLIDDGSTDKSGIICDEYSRKDNRIRVFHKNNEGQAEARNVGLRQANGDYIMFVDSDDMVDKEMCQTLLKIMLRNDVDFVMCNFLSIYTNEYKKKNINKFKNGQLYTGRQGLELHVKKGPTELAVVWNKLYKTELFRRYNLFFVKGRIHEDELICKYILYYTRKFIYIDKMLYMYFRRNDSTMGKIDRKRFVDGAFFVMELYAFIQKKVPSLEPWAWKRMQDEWYGLATLQKKSKIEIKNTKLNILRKKIMDCRPNYNQIYKLGYKCLIKFLFFQVHLENILSTFLSIKEGKGYKNGNSPYQ